MKTYLLFLVISFLIISCGPKASEMEARRIADSTLMSDAINRPNNMKESEIVEQVNLNTKTPEGKKFIKTASLKFKVDNVQKSTEKIEDIAAKYDGYLIYSNLSNNEQCYKSSRISRDSLMVSKQIVVINDMQLRIPNTKLDSFVRELNSLILFFDYRIIKLNDVTLDFTSIQKRASRLQKYEQRQTKHIDARTEKLKSTTEAEDNLLDRQNVADDLSIRSAALEDKIKYCDISINIYQKPVIVKDVIADFDYAADSKPSFGKRLINSIVQGWHVLEEVVLFIIKLWGVILLIIGIIFSTIYLRVIYRNLKGKLNKVKN